jgi:hypothetical protein
MKPRPSSVVVGAGEQARDGGLLAHPRVEEPITQVNPL